MTYAIQLTGTALHCYGDGVYGWGPVSSTTGTAGRLVEFTLESEAHDWINKRKVFCAGSVVVDLEPSTADLLDGLRKAKEEADKASAELADAMRLHRFNRLADQLEDAFGPVPMSRPDLLAFLADQVKRIKALECDSATATALIDAAYMELQTQHG